MKKVIISCNRSGLANRLKCLVSSLRIADLYAMRLVLDWPVTEDCGARFEQLFSNPVPRCSFIYRLSGSVRNSDWRFWLSPDDPTPIGSERVLTREVERAFMRGASHPRPNSIPSSADCIDYEFHRTPLALRKTYLHYFSQLKIQPALQEIIDDYKNLLGSETIGIHIRRGDMVRVVKEYGRFRSYVGNGTIPTLSTEADFYAAMKEGRRFFLATDDQKVENEFREKFGSRIIVFPKKSWRRSDQQGVKDALVDLALLGSCFRIIGSFSTFTELGWWLGGAKTPVMIAGSKEASAFEGYQKNFVECGDVHSQPEFSSA